MLCKENHPCCMSVAPLQDEKKQYCNKEIYTGGLEPTAKSGSYYKFEIPLSLFQCGKGSGMNGVSNINRIDIMNMNIRDADFCIDYLAVISGSAPVKFRPTAPTPAPAEAEPAETPVPAVRAPPRPVTAAPVAVPAVAPAAAPTPAPPPPAPRAGWFPFIFPFFFGR